MRSDLTSDIRFTSVLRLLSLGAALLFLFILSSTASAQTERDTEPERTSQEVLAFIDQQGRARPDWWEDVELDYPETLDLDWPQQPSGGWNSQRNVGQYLWDVINPNTNRWRQGIRFMHFLLLQHQDDPQIRTRAMQTLASMYYNFEQDYARAAFWWDKAGIRHGVNHPAVVKVAICYWKLGNRQMGYQTLSGLASHSIYYNMVKVLADMGYTDVALSLTERLSESPRRDWAFLYAGDACRVVGRYDDAIEYYEKILQLRGTTEQQRNQYTRTQERARASIAAIRIYDSLDLSTIPDGTYRASTRAYAGPIHVSVTIEDGKITDVKVTQHQEKQFYSSITDTPRQIVAKQGVQGVDAVTGATITSEAIVNAVAKALGEAMP
jgi:uncharacterized protein with FMN-binding domain